MIYSKSILFLLCVSFFVQAQEVIVLEDNPKFSIGDFQVFSDGLPYAMSESKDFIFSCLDKECNKAIKSKLATKEDFKIKSSSRFRKTLFESPSGMPVVFYQRDEGKNNKKRDVVYLLVCEDRVCSSYHITKMATMNEEYLSFEVFSSKNHLPIAIQLGYKYQCKNQECNKISKKKWLNKLDTEKYSLEELMSNNSLLIENTDTDDIYYLHCKDDKCNKFSKSKVPIVDTRRFWGFDCFENNKYQMLPVDRREARKYNTFSIDNGYQMHKSNFIPSIYSVDACLFQNGKYYIAGNFASKNIKEDRLLICSDLKCENIIKNIDLKTYIGVKEIKAGPNGDVWMSTDLPGAVLLKF